VCVCLSVLKGLT